MDDISGKWLKMANKTAEKKETLSAISEKQAAARKKLVKISDLVTDQKFEKYIRKHTKEEFNALYSSIELEGKLREPITVRELDGGNFLVIDGHHRLRVAKALVGKGLLNFESLPVNVEQFENDDEIFVWMLHNQLGRRNLSPFERAEIGFRISSFVEELALKKKQHQQIGNKHLSKWIKVSGDTKIDYAKIVSELTGVPRTTIIRAKKLHNKASEKLKYEIRAGEVSISKAYEQIVEQEKIDKQSERAEKRKNNFKKHIFQIKEIEQFLSPKVLAKVLGLNTTGQDITVIQKTKNSLLYALNQGKAIDYVRVFYQSKILPKGLENYVIYILHEGNDFVPPENIGFVSIDPTGKLKVVNKCSYKVKISTQNELKLLRSVVIEGLKK